MSKKINAILLTLSLAILFISCDQNKNNNQKKSNPKVEETQKEPEKVIEVIGVYTGRDNLGMESSIIINNNGILYTKSSIGDGSLSEGRWYGDANNLSLYLFNEFGGEDLLGYAKVNENGIQIIGGNYYRRQ